MYYSTFTSLLRAPITSDMEEAVVSSQCFGVAYLALESHLRLCSLLSRVLLFSSFTPFIVIFLRAIAATSREDVQLLEEISESLRKIQKVSRSSERLYQICSTFTRIAKEFVRNRKSCGGLYDHEDGT